MESEGSPCSEVEKLDDAAAPSAGGATVLRLHYIGKEPSASLVPLLDLG